MEQHSIFCANCSTQLNGKYCHYCGEQRLDNQTRSIAYISGAFVTEVTSLDSKILNTIKLFFLYPGKQVRDFHLGIRKRHFSLISLFFIFNLLYFLNSSMTDFNLSLVEQLHQPYSAFITPTVEQTANIESNTFEILKAKYDAMSKTIAKSLIIISVPLFALLLPIINYKRDYYLQDHVMFALNAYAFILIWPIICRYAISFIVWLLPFFSVLTDHYFNILLLGEVIFLWFAQKNAYACSKLEASVKIIPLVLLLFASHMMYRYVQFWLTWWQIN